MSKTKPSIIPVHTSKDFVGIKIFKDKIEVYVPLAFREEKDDQLNFKNVLRFLNSISLAKTIQRDNIKKSDNSLTGQFWPIDSYMWIIYDYLNNGNYYNLEKTFSNDSKGKINWKRTMKGIPIYVDDSFIYDKFVTSKTTASNDIITQIYKLCLRQALDRIGWAYVDDFYVDVQQPASKKRMIFLVNREISFTFDDIKKLRFKHMLKILNGIQDDGSLSNYHEYGITHYHYVFEVMVDSFFQGIDKINKSQYYPSGNWDLLDENEIIKSSDLIPDTINIRDRRILIIDAKMFTYGMYLSNSENVKNTLPGTSSIQKQITYADFLKNVVQHNKDIVINNAFIMPFNKELDLIKNNTNVEKYLNDNLIYIGIARPTWRRVKEKYDDIYTFLIDFNYLLNNYNKKQDEFIDTLYDVINEKEL